MYPTHVYWRENLVVVQPATDVHPMRMDPALGQVVTGTSIVLVPLVAPLVVVR
jgi:hypothetical protein